MLARLNDVEPQQDWVAYCQGEIALRKALQAEDPKNAPELERAEALFRETLDCTPDHYMARVSLGIVAGMKGELVEGFKLLETARDRSPHRADAYFGLGRIYARSGEVDAAVRSIETGLEKEEGRADGYMLYGEVLLRYRNQVDEALKAFRKTLEIDPDHPGAADTLSALLLTLGVRALNKKKFDDVLRIVEEVLEISPANASALNLRGQVFLLMEEDARAIASFRECLASDPDHREGRYHLARTLVKEGYRLLFLKRREEALSLFQEAVDLDAPEVDLTVVRRILEDNEKAAAAGPDEAPAAVNETGKARRLFEEATALLEGGKPNDALELLRRSLELLPENPYAHHQAGLALDALNRPGEAEEELKTALDLGQRIGIDLQATYLKLAELALKDERYGEAAGYLDKHDERFPGQASSPVAESLRRLLILARDREE
jgi:tetratricopeptide (TPR) repeat protein